MRRFRAFSLTEILTGMMLQAGFIIVLLTTFYMLLNFQSANTKLITAREKGQKVLDYIHNRIIHAGLGLWRCKSPDDIREAFGGSFSKTDSLPFSNITLPVAVTSCDTSKTYGWRETRMSLGGDGIFRGNVLTVLYAMPYSFSVIRLRNNASGFAKMTSKDVVNCQFLGDSAGITLGKLDEYAAGFVFKDMIISAEGNLRAWKVTASSGVPLYISSFTNGDDFNLTTRVKNQSIDISSGSELLTLYCEKMYVDNAYLHRVFSCVKLRNFNTWMAAGNAPGYNKSYENGILDIYFELDTHTNILDCRVLASGGRDASLDTKCPVSWPAKRWKDEYKYYTVYVSRSSWKLHNIPSGFRWY